MNLKSSIIVASLSLLIMFSNLHAQTQIQELKSIEDVDKAYSAGLENDWLVSKPELKAGVFRNSENNELILSNGIISRTLRVSPNGATTSLKVLKKGEEHIRAIKPEAIVSIDGFTVNVGGLIGQPNLAFLYPDWLDDLKADPLSFQLTGFEIGTPEKRLDWKKVRHHAPDAAWPPKGVKLQMNYQLRDVPTEDLIGLSEGSNIGRFEIYHDNFSTLSPVWNVKTSPAHERSSFVNEGKPGEIYTPNNTAVYAEYKLPAGTGLVETSIDAETDQSGYWGPGIALLWEDRIIKFNIDETIKIG